MEENSWSEEIMDSLEVFVLDLVGDFVARLGEVGTKLAARGAQE